MKKLLFSLMAVGSICLHAQQKVGVNTETPKATLHVATGTDGDGNMIIRQTPQAANTDQPLVWNPATKEVKTANTQKKPYYLLKFKVNCIAKEDYIKNFDTKIPTNKYKVILVSAWPETPQNTEWLNIRHIENKSNFIDFNDGKSRGYVNPIRKALMFEDNGTWRLTIDYPHARPEAFRGYDGHFTWNITLLAIDLNEIKTLPDQTGATTWHQELGGNPDVSLPNPLN
ncbi:hypothetical protein EQP59_06070 [Ornithobacterium rhinotracheale]|uniref:Uncharacterized protein n=1 Tax=Ornithobacterium rhinotracheale TaxID=28251 RepID=A0A3R5WZR9_ORNRH|nr:hypothetical protein [Ornithobacterium rhinotracheale]QAR30930.1 hypothetical protein EQP59_06070 [Ornithobacterium rhinotracheale]